MQKMKLRDGKMRGHLAWVEYAGHENDRVRVYTRRPIVQISKYPRQYIVSGLNS